MGGGNLDPTLMCLLSALDTSSPTESDLVIVSAQVQTAGLFGGEGNLVPWGTSRDLPGEWPGDIPSTEKITKKWKVTLKKIKSQLRRCPKSGK